MLFKKIIGLFVLLIVFFTVTPFLKKTYSQYICSGAAPQSPTTTATSGTFYVYAYGVTSTYVWFPTWTEANGQDDIVWYVGTNMGGGTFRGAINLASHTGLGLINVHVYLSNSTSPSVFCGTANFTRVAVPTITPTPTATPTPTPTATPTPTPTPTPIPKWIKLKDTSFSSTGSLDNPIPLVISAYDSDDNASQRYFIGNTVGIDPGAVLSSSINLNGANSSSKNWQAAYSKSTLMTPAGFLSYVKARKEYKTITDIDNIIIEDYNNKILVFSSGTFTISDANKSTFDNRNLVIIINGDLNLSASSFIPSNAATAFVVTGAITFSATTTEVRGIFIATTGVSTGSTVNQGLKVVGNLATTSLDNSRRWTNLSKPSLFIVFKQDPFITLLPLLSTANYNWRQIQ